MAISFDKALGMAENSFRLRAERASVLSANLANADTPNYKARDINFQEALSARMGDSNMSSMSMKATSRGHISSHAAQEGFAERYYRLPSQPSIDGNTVEENVEHAEFMKNNLEFQASFTFLNGRFKGLTKAIKGE